MITPSVWSIGFEAKDFSRSVSGGVCHYTVDRLTWLDEGGPDVGEVRADGPLPALNNLVQRLRQPVTVFDGTGTAAWWGYVHGVELHLDGMIYLVSLDGLANRVAVRWSDEDPYLNSSADWQYQSAWEDDVYSQREYGIKEMVFSIGEGRQAGAEAARRTHLLQRRLPRTISVPAAALQEPYAVLKLRGWYATLGWRFWAEARGFGGVDGTFPGNLGKGGLDFTFGNASASSRVKQAFHTGSLAWEVSDIWLRLCKFGSPVDNVVVELCDGGAGTATTAPGTVRASWSIGGANISRDSGTWLRLSFTTPFLLTAPTFYMVVVSRSGAVDAANYYRVRVEEDASLNGAFGYLNVSTWTARTPNADMVMAALGQEETTTQIKNIIAGVGQFLTGVRIQDASGLKTRLYRPGKERADREIHEHLLTGAADGRRLLARVNRARQFVVEKQPASTSPGLRIMPGGKVVHLNGRPLLPAENPVGKWAVIESMLRAGGDAGEPGVAYISGAEWTAKEGLRVKWE